MRTGKSGPSQVNHTTGLNSPSGLCGGVAYDAPSDGTVLNPSAFQVLTASSSHATSVGNSAHDDQQYAVWSRLGSGAGKSFATVIARLPFVASSLVGSGGRGRPDFGMLERFPREAGSCVGIKRNPQVHGCVVITPLAVVTFSSRYQV
jgi:hypothetical protein